MNDRMFHIDRARSRLGCTPWKAIASIAAIIGIIVGIGTMLGWWTVHNPGQPGSAIEGKVRKRGDRSWHDIEGAAPGAEVEYHVALYNSGSIELDHLSLTISPPEGIRLIAGSCVYRVGSSSRRCPSDWIERGIGRSSLKPEANLVLTVRGALARHTPDGLLSLRTEANADQTEPVADVVPVKPRATHAQAAARGLVREAGMDAPIDWISQPEPAARSELLLARRWRILNPERLHRFASVHSRQLVSLERLAHDRRLDGQVITVISTVEEEPVTYAGYRPRAGGGTEAGGPRLTRQIFVMLGERMGAVASCVTTRESGHRLHDGDRVRIHAVPLAWGTATLNDATVAAVALDCAAIRRLPATAEDGGGADAPNEVNRCEISQPAA